MKKVFAVLLLVLIAMTMLVACGSGESKQYAYDEDGHWDISSDEIEQKGYERHNYKYSICTDCGWNENFNMLKFEKSKGGKSYEIVGRTYNYKFRDSDTYTNILDGIPEYYNGLPIVKVSALYDSTFYDNKKLIIPKSVKEIGYNAFKGCTGIKEIVITNAATIGTTAFSL